MWDVCGCDRVGGPQAGLVRSTDTYLMAWREFFLSYIMHVCTLTVPAMTGAAGMLELRLGLDGFPAILCTLSCPGCTAVQRCRPREVSIRQAGVAWLSDVLSGSWIRV